ncbi:hypothetical protein GQ43DRAFT_472463 [Delitschia confertaspora ATCC 74209]|uniref:BTB domain-containing protein n=1 Tax=Delitschia confertaspora ATCC 74209 TaxID=1513339 RepID=A0A9P4JKD2_9PLEO|nr:hypothetical protein GQ43DRAFT_472463 [Delitschia confertaspora ATCC 74209]
MTDMRPFGAEERDPVELLSLLDGPAVEFVLAGGPYPATYYIPWKLLSRHSESFGGEMYEMTASVPLVDEERVAFRLFLVWLYRGYYEESFDDTALTERTTEPLPSIKAYLFGHRYGFEGFKNHAMRHIYKRYATFTDEAQRARHKVRITPEVVHYVFKHSLTGNNLQRLFRDIVCNLWCGFCKREHVMLAGEKVEWDRLFLNWPEFRDDVLWNRGPDNDFPDVGYYLHDIGVGLGS